MKKKKAVLVTDMPKCCNDCKCNFDHWCSFDNFERHIDDLEQKPKWCPLKPLPDKLNNFEPILVPKDISGILNNMYGEYENGWNDCLDEIARETE